MYTLLSISTYLSILFQQKISIYPGLVAFCVVAVVRIQRVKRHRHNTAGGPNSAAQSYTAVAPAPIFTGNLELDYNIYLLYKAKRPILIIFYLSPVAAKLIFSAKE